MVWTPLWDDREIRKKAGFWTKGVLGSRNSKGKGLVWRGLSLTEHTSTFVDRIQRWAGGGAGEAVSRVVASVSIFSEQG